MLAEYIQKIDAHVREHKRISLGDLIEMAGRDGLLIPLMVVAIFNIILSPIPFNSLFFGIPLLVLSLLYLFDADPKRHGQWLMKRSIPCESWLKYMHAAVPYAQKLQNRARPRWASMMRVESRAMSGILLVIMSVIIFLPLPFLNIQCSLSILFIAFGIMQRDGLFLLMGYALVLLHMGLIVALHYGIFS